MKSTSLVLVAVVAAAAVAIMVLKPTRHPAEPNASPAAAVSSIPTPVALPRLLDLGANKCIPCKMMTPILDDLKTTYAGSLTVDFIDVWQDRAAGEQHHIQSIPTQIFFAPDGKELFRHEGFFAKEDILAQWTKLGYALKPAAKP